MSDQHLTPACRAVTAFVNVALAQGLSVQDLALAMIGAGTDLLVPVIGAERVLAACDELVECAAHSAANKRAQH